MPRVTSSWNTLACTPAACAVARICETRRWPSTSSRIVRWRWLKPRERCASSATPSAVLTGIVSSVRCNPVASLFPWRWQRALGRYFSKHGRAPLVAAQAGRIREQADAYFAPMSRAPKTSSPSGRKTTTATQTFTDAQAALDHAGVLYEEAVRRLRKALQGFISGRQFHSRVRECYPSVRVSTQTVARGRLAAHLWFRGRARRLRDHADAARPVRRLLPRAVPPAAARTTVSRSKSGTSTQPIPVHFSLAENDHIEGTLSAERRLLMRDLFDLPDLAAMDDGIANGTLRAAATASAQPLSLFTAPRGGLFAAPAAPLHRHRARALPELRAVHQLPVLHRRVRAARPRGRWPTQNSDYMRLRRAGQRDHAARAAAHPRPRRRRWASPPPRLPQMPAYHLVRERPQRHHDGQHRRRPGQRQDHHRPRRGAAPARLDDARPLRGPAQHASSSATTCWPTATCARTMCSTRSCRCGCRSRRWPRSSWRWSRRWPT